MNKAHSVTIKKINIVAENYDETVEFYRLLGVNIPAVTANPSKTRHAPATDHGTSSFSIDNPALSKLYSAEWREATSKNSALLTAQLPSREAVDSTYTELLDAGHEGIQIPYDAFWGARYAVVRDPEGNSVGLESPMDDEMQMWPPVQSPNTQQ